MNDYRVVPMSERPMSSHEIQEVLGRMPTKEERSAFSQWRNNNPNVYLCERDAAVARAHDNDETQRWLALSDVERAMESLTKQVGPETCTLIVELVEAMLKEKHGD